MQTLPMPVTGTALSVRRTRQVPRLAQWIAAVPALGILLALLVEWASSHAPAPWPLWVGGAALALALIAEPVARVAARRPLPAFTAPAGILAALVLVSFGLADLHRPSALARLVGVLLAAALVMGPVGRRLIRSRSPHDVALALGALAAMLSFVWTLAVDGVGNGTNTQWAVVDDLHLGTVRLVLGLLAVVLVAIGAEGEPAIRRLVAFAAALGALIVLLATLVSSNPAFLWPAYPYEWAAGFLSFGLVVALPILLAEDRSVGAHDAGTGVASAIRRSSLSLRLAAADGEMLGDLTQSGAMLVSLGVLAVALFAWKTGHGYQPTWPLVSSAVVLALGLFAEPLARVTRRPAPASAQPAAMFAGLLLLGFGSADPHPPVALLRVVAVALGVGLVAGSLGRLVAGGRSALALVLPVTALAAIVVFIWTLAVDGYTWFTGTTTRVVVDDLHTGTVRLVFWLLAAVLVATAARRAEAVRRLVALAAAVTALVLLLATLVSAGPGRFWPEYPYLWAAGFLSLGIAAESLVRFVGLPSAEVLAERVNELSRTRTGALDVQATELRRIERDLHDGAQVRLIALSMKLGRAEDLYRDDPETAALLREAREDATAAIRELRELARGIAPPVLANRGLDAAVRSLAQRSGVEVAVTARLTRRLLPAVETAAYFVVAESLANAAKHAPGARVEIALHERGGDLFADITDFGPGGADPAGGGLTGLRQRAEALDGELHVTSPAGLGTHIEAVLPCGR